MNKSMKNFFIFTIFYGQHVFPHFILCRALRFLWMNLALVHFLVVRLLGVICSKTVMAKSDITFLALCSHNG